MINIQLNEPLSKHTTMHIGGNAKKFICADNDEVLANALADAQAENDPVFILGAGSNLLVCDDGFEGVVIKMTDHSVEWQAEDDGSMRVTIGAGALFDDVAEAACKQGLGGIECMSGIPGTLGGAVVQNIGAYGQEISEVFVSAQAMHRQSLETVTLTAQDMAFGYRTTALKTPDNPYIILRATLRLPPFIAEDAVRRCVERNFGRLVTQPPKSAADMRDIVLKTRRAKGMCYDRHDVNTHSVGSFFVNPILSEEEAQRHNAANIIRNQKRMPMYPAENGMKLSAAWLIEQSDFTRGFIHNGAALSAYHTLAIVNRSNASCSDVLELAQLIVKGVFKRFHITLAPEVVYLGKLGIEPLPIVFPK